MFGKKKATSANEIDTLKVKALEWLNLSYKQVCDGKKSLDYFDGMLQLSFFLNLISNDTYRAFTDAEIKLMKK